MFLCQTVSSAVPPVFEITFALRTPGFWILGIGLLDIGLGMFSSSLDLLHLSFIFLIIGPCKFSFSIFLISTFQAGARRLLGTFFSSNPDLHPGDFVLHVSGSSFELACLSTDFLFAPLYFQFFSSCSSCSLMCKGAKETFIKKKIKSFGFGQSEGVSQQENIITEIINIGTWYLSLRANCTSTLVVNSAFSSFNLFTSFSSSVFSSYHAYSISPSFFISRFSTSPT